MNEVSSLKAQVAATQMQMVKLTVNTIQTPFQVCELCVVSHATQEYQVGNSLATKEQANYLNNFQGG